MNPNNPNADVEMSAVETAAVSLGKEMRIFRASSEGEIEVAFTTMVQQRRAALLVASDVFFLSHRDQLSSLAALYRIPAIYYLREFVEVGGLMAYGNRLPDAYRQVGIYVGRILKGEKPGDLPVQQSTKFELVINLKTAKALGIEIPILMQLLADEVIE
jgi:putative ABC transport system substrate-binding protein